MPNIYEQHLDRNPANFAPLSPIPLLERAASVFPDHPSVVHGARRYTWSETWERARRLGSACRGAASARAIPWRSCCPTSRRCSNAISAFP